MNMVLKVGFFCVMLLSCSSLASAQSAGGTDPCGDPTAESSSWNVVSGKVVKVEDGDTFTIFFKGRRVRIHLIGINAPERGEPFGEASLRLLESMVSGKTVFVLVSSKWMRRRTFPTEMSGVVKLRNIEMLDVNLLMIQSGLARHKESEPYSMSNYIECHYVKAEEDAQNARRGLWRGAA